jgi:HTH-type transcriptional regulator/antitoxin HigA
MVRRTRPAPPHGNRAGRLLDRTLEDMEWYQADLRRASGMSAKHINLMVKGHIAISPTVAVKLEAATGIQAIEWLWMSTLDQLDLARRTAP